MNELVKHESSASPAVLGALAIEQVVNQVTLVQQVMGRVMKQGEHYGVIPGTGTKPSLLKPGAEKLAFTFRLRPDFDILESFQEDRFISYTVKCSLTQIETGAVWGTGIGNCNSKESKYRFRLVATDKRPSKDEAAAMKAKGLGNWRKLGGGWVWHDRVENDNPWDQANTILKMAEKRALVAAVLVSTAASDIFTQDIEDLAANGVIDAEFHEAPPTGSGSSAKTKDTPGEPEPVPPPQDNPQQAEARANIKRWLNEDHDADPEKIASRLTDMVGSYRANVDELSVGELRAVAGAMNYTERLKAEKEAR